MRERFGYVLGSVLTIVLASGLGGCGKDGNSGWQSAETPVRVGDVEIRIKKVHYGKPDHAASVPKSIAKDIPENLVVNLEIANLSSTKRIDYIAWSRDTQHANDLTMFDEHGNPHYSSPYPLKIKFIQGMSDRELVSIAPGETFQDVLIFLKQPVAAATELRMTLPASNVGEKGKFQIVIPRKMFAP
jgi:hypothetical protein